MRRAKTPGRIGRRLAVVTLAAGAVGIVPFPATSGVPAAETSTDFNGDGSEDLAAAAIGSGEFNRGGSVTVLYGSGGGLVTAGAQLLTQNTPGVADTRQAGDEFGSFVEGADIEGDGYDDLFVGVQGEGVGGKQAAGGFHVFSGAIGGLSGADSTWWHRGTPGVLGSPGVGDNFGWWFATGDFDGDTFMDVAVSAPFDRIGDVPEAGSVQVFYGSAAGLSTRDQVWTQESVGVPGKAQASDWFGWTVAAGDFDTDGDDDLAVTAPRDRVGGDIAGSVTILQGDLGGLTGAGSQLLTQDTPGVLGAAAPNDFFGDSVAAGDVDADGTDDLAVGVSGDRVGTDRAGAVAVFPGSPGGLIPMDDELWTLDSPGVPGRPKDGDGLGWSTSISDLDNDGDGDLAAGAPTKGVAGEAMAGALLVLYGSPAGLALAELWTQASPGVPSVPEGPPAPGRIGDMIGYFTRGRDVNGDGFADLLISVLGEDDERGAVQVLLGSPTGATATGQQYWTQGSPGVPGERHRADGWGIFLA